ncbi:MAG: hypothetical protein JNM90_05815 [Burkholderiales bacterium]|nr:hypothetical protein [Burkholderiales bacterium]
MEQHCPHCNARLFADGRIDPRAFGEDPRAPRVEHAGALAYVTCPACAQPVRVEAAVTETGTAYVVSHDRK